MPASDSRSRCTTARKVGARSVALFLACFSLRGRRLGRKPRIRATELVAAKVLRRRVLPFYRRLLGAVLFGPRAASYRIAGVP